MTSDHELPCDLLPLREAAKLLPGTRPGRHLCIDVLRRWTWRGTLASWKIGGRLYVSRSEVLKQARPVVVKDAPAVVRCEGHARAVEELTRRGVM